jgi:hypothetical protein
MRGGDAAQLVQAVPPLVLGPAIGLVVDRSDKQLLMVWTSLARAAAVVALIFCQDAAAVPWVYALTFVKFAFSALYQPARAAIVPEVVAPGDLVISNGLDGIVWSCMVFVGGAVGGFATAFLGVTWSYIIDSACYVVAAAITAYVGGSNPWSLLRSAVGRPPRPRAYAAVPAASAIELDDRPAAPPTAPGTPEAPSSATDADAPDSTFATADDGVDDDDNNNHNDDKAEDGGSDKHVALLPVPAAPPPAESAAPAAPAAARASASFWAQVVGGWTYLWSEPYLLAVCHLKACLWLVRVSPLLVAPVRLLSARAAGPAAGGRDHQLDEHSLRRDGLCTGRARVRLARHHVHGGRRRNHGHARPRAAVWSPHPARHPGTPVRPPKHTRAHTDRLPRGGAGRSFWWPRLHS